VKKDFSRKKVPQSHHKKDFSRKKNLQTREKNLFSLNKNLQTHDKNLFSLEKVPQTRDKVEQSRDKNLHLFKKVLFYCRFFRLSLRQKVENLHIPPLWPLQAGTCTYPPP
jgi:hypothetical protein